MHPSCGGAFFTLYQVSRRSRVILGVMPDEFRIQKHPILGKNVVHFANANSPKTFREKLTADVTVVGHVEQELPSGRSIFFALTLMIEPLAETFAFHRVSHTLGPDGLPEELLSLSIETLHHELAGGGRFGFPLQPLSISISSVDYRDGQSTDVAVRLATSTAFKQFLQDASFATIQG